MAITGIVNGGKNPQIAGARIGETILLYLANGRAEKIILSDITRVGVEGFEVSLKDQPLTFYPYTAILKIKKYTEITQG